MNDGGRFARFTDDQQPGFSLQKPRKRLPWRWPVALLSILVVGIGTIILYVTSLQPVDPTAKSSVRIVIDQGETAASIAAKLYDHGLIRNPKVFELYTQLSGIKGKLQAGGFMLKKSQSVSEIADHLTSGKSDEMNLTFLPGLTLEALADPQVKGSLAHQGFNTEEIRRAFAKTYNSPLFAGRPSGASLEGYIYPETYVVAADTALDTAIKMTLDEFYKQVKSRDLEEKLKKQNLSLRQGIILASIVQMEVSNKTDQKQVAQVFLRRLQKSMVLGSDVTFMYIAKKEGRTPSVNDPSPYNTRKNPGLPPGPIANFHIEALEAVAEPASGDYEYFVAGDDGKTYFARTEAEHNQNVAKYCTELCR